MPAAILRLVLPRERTYQEVIDYLGMQEATWVRRKNWVGKPTLFTLTKREPKALYQQMLEAYKQGYIDRFEYEGQDQEGERVWMRLRGKWWRQWI
jgi:hypothetical protein